MVAVAGVQAVVLQRRMSVVSVAVGRGGCYAVEAYAQELCAERPWRHFRRAAERAHPTGASWLQRAATSTA